MICPKCYPKDPLVLTIILTNLAAILLSFIEGWSLYVLLWGYWVSIAITFIHSRLDLISRRTKLFNSLENPLTRARIERIPSELIYFVLFSLGALVLITAAGLMPLSPRDALDIGFIACIFSVTYVTSLIFSRESSAGYREYYDRPVVKSALLVAVGAAGWVEYLMYRFLVCGAQLKDCPLSVNDPQTLQLLGLPLVALFFVLKFYEEVSNHRHKLGDASISEKFSSHQTHEAPEVALKKRERRVAELLRAKARLRRVVKHLFMLMLPIFVLPSVFGYAGADLEAPGAAAIGFLILVLIVFAPLAIHLRYNNSILSQEASRRPKRRLEFFVQFMVALGFVSSASINPLFLPYAISVCAWYLAYMLYLSILANLQAEGYY